MSAELRVVPMEKVCSKCKVSKPYSEYSKNSAREIGITPSCKECRNKAYKEKNRELTRTPRPGRFKKYFSSYLMYEYGITFEQAKETLRCQLGKCANKSCGTEINFDAPKASKHRAVIDHDHVTGKFRAILCHKCNVQMGVIENPSNIMLGLVEYLSRHNVSNHLTHKHKEGTT